MKRSIARWTTTMVAAAMIAVPTAGYAQTQPPQPPSAPPAQTTPAPQGAQPASDQDAAKQHLTAARNALSEMTQLPAAQQLTGEARTQVSQLISNFNELITTNADWRGSYAKLATNLNALVGASTTDEAAARPTGTAGAVGTSGTVTLDPAIKAKLIEFRSHLEKFEKAAGGMEPSAPTNPAATSAPPSAAPPSTPSEPANPTEPRRMDEEQILNHIAAIEAIIGVQPPPTGTTGTGAASSANLTLTTAQIEQLRTHLAELKKLVQK
jgi:hypothetical protein